MNSLKRIISNLVFQKNKSNVLIPYCHRIRHFCEDTSRIHLEKSVNHVVLLGRVGIDPQLRGTENKPVVVFTLATNTNYKYETGEMRQKTDWHRIAIFKASLRETVLEYLKKGNRVYVDGKIVYSEYNDAKGNVCSSTSIVANDVIFLSNSPKGESSQDSEEVD
ncbi:single-stranded DNA-binding protein, mitochondrial [Trichonephila inaurata madagascariensis]|uniref:Single-stranded DNA-binding protein, mitochondrial n=2 Tax=Trichonephila inaurata madagascariensis TaxID=2747483 RepID=A0A8X6Y4L8_9ARAC|nr:single-stranded DNA-binding protein, mitochondrial [Trichonephila inaurata madagascariensis]